MYASLTWSSIFTRLVVYFFYKVSGVLMLELDNAFILEIAYGAMGHRIDPSWGGPIELFLVPASAPRLV